MDLTEANQAKRFSAESAVGRVKDGMVIGLGSRATAEIANRIIGEKVKDGFQIVGIPTSHESEELARNLGIRVSTLAEHPQLDLTIDGADEVELGSLDLIKGRGGALLREKIVANSSRQLIIVVDESKIVDRLGSHGELPVEVVPFAWQSTVLRLKKLGWKPALRLPAEGSPCITDGGHYILDCSSGWNDALQSRAVALHNTVGVVEHGMFLGMATEVHVGNAKGVRVLQRSTTPHHGQRST